MLVDSVGKNIHAHSLTTTQWGCRGVHTGRDSLVTLKPIGMKLLSHWMSLTIQCIWLPHYYKSLPVGIPFKSAPLKIVLLTPLY